MTSGMSIRGVGTSMEMMRDGGKKREEDGKEALRATTGAVTVMRV